MHLAHRRDRLQRHQAHIPLALDHQFSRNEDKHFVAICTAGTDDFARSAGSGPAKAQHFLDLGRREPFEDRNLLERLQQGFVLFHLVEYLHSTNSTSHLKSAPA
jgi:hypothetical protein